MAHTVVLGMQWGDEGKGKIVDLICPAFGAVARYQGGHNAGHTVKFADRHFALHFLPSGILHGGTVCALGNGMVIYPPAFFEELEGIRGAGIDVEGRLLLSDRAQVILDPHTALDKAREASLGDGKLGTTTRGIGPAYETKVVRRGLRVGDLFTEGLEGRIEALMAHLEPQLAALGAGPSAALPELVRQCREWGERLRPFVCDTAARLNGYIDDGRSVLFEGAQGALLDIDHGTYPFVTSSNATVGGVATGTGVPPTRIGAVLGVIKAYTTRVGTGPFVTELFDEVGEHLRTRGNEQGTTTGRPRRCGWFDAPAARYSRMINGTTALALTKLDVLDELDEVRICTGYRWRGRMLESFPAAIEVLESVEPVYETMPGWQSTTVGILAFEDLPSAARAYVRRLEELVGAPACMVSTGPRREETILTAHPALAQALGGKVDTVLAHRGTP